MNQRNLSTASIVLMSCGSLIGCGWLFSPYYGLEVAGIGVLISWLIIFVITCIIGLTFAEVVSIAPIGGGTTRLIGLTHNRRIFFILVILGWVGSVVFLPLEVLSTIQYLGFWVHSLVATRVQGDDHLSLLGFGAAVFTIIVLTTLNTFLIKRVLKINSWISIWKIGIPVIVAILILLLYGKWYNFNFHYTHDVLSIEKIFEAITQKGLAFAFTGFQAGLILANHAHNPKRAIPHSLFYPLVIGFVIYTLLSLTFLFCLPINSRSIHNHGVAPLLSLIFLLGANMFYVVLFIDAIVAPLGSANMYISGTSRILYNIGIDFKPHSWLTKLNKNNAPIYCLWLNALIGIIFLLPLPSWSTLVNLLSSLVIFTYIVGPVVLLVLRAKAVQVHRTFKIPFHQLISYLSFAFCSLLIYWSGFINLIVITLLTLGIYVGYYIVITSNKRKAERMNSWDMELLLFLVGMVIIAYYKKQMVLVFPFDNILVFILGIITCYFLVKNSLTEEEITTNLSIHQH
ncbi:MAG: APC family permease [Phycisphaerales bacterium]|nr:APC family permease [Phycisphaerales bacterium]